MLCLCLPKKFVVCFLLSLLLLSFNLKYHNFLAFDSLQQDISTLFVFVIVWECLSACKEQNRQNNEFLIEIVIDFSISFSRYLLLVISDERKNPFSCFLFLFCFSFCYVFLVDFLFCLNENWKFNFLFFSATSKLLPLFAPFFLLNFLNLENLHQMSRKEGCWLRQS
jgi:hypothetical protein